MIEINLLPKGYQKTGFSLSMGKSGLYAVAGGAAVVVALMAVTMFQLGELKDLDQNIERAKQRAEMLRKDIQIVDALTDVKAKITRRVAAIERLDRNRSVWVRILEEMSGDVPEFVWLTRFTEHEAPAPKVAKADAKADKGKNDDEGSKADQPLKPATSPDQAQPSFTQVEIEGYAFTLNSVAALMINLMRSDYFDEVEMSYTNETKFDEYRAYNFVLSCNMHFLSDDQARRMIVQAEGDQAAADASHKSLN
ncbi:MAG: PilN domain-containing protein [bacterium]